MSATDQKQAEAPTFAQGAEELPFMSVNVSRMIAKASPLNATEFGVLMRLILLAWQYERCTLPSDVKWLEWQLRLKLKCEKMALRLVIDKFCTIEGETLFLPELREKRAEALAASAKKRAAGSLGGNAKAQNRRTRTDEEIGDNAIGTSPRSDGGGSAPPSGERARNSRKEAAFGAEGDARANEHDTRISTAGQSSGELFEGTFDAVIDALGVDRENLSRYWQGPLAVDHVSKWKTVLGLTDAEIIAEAKASRVKNPAPPDGPKALDRWMEQAAAARQAGPTPRDPKEVAKAAPKASMEDRLKHYADLVNNAKFNVHSFISPTMARALIEAGLVTPAKMKERGVAF